MKRLFLILVFFLPLVAQEAAKRPQENAPPAEDYNALKARVVELEKQLAQQGALAQEFAKQASNCSIALTVYQVTHPEPPKDDKK